MKRMTLKKILAIACALCMVLVLFAGCGDAAESAAPAAQTSSAEAEEQAPVLSEMPEAEQAEPASAVEESVLEPEEEFVDTWTWPVADEGASLTMWYAYPPFFPNYYETADEFPDFVYCQEQTGIDLIFTECTFVNAMENITLMLASGSYPDMIFNLTDYVSTNLEYAVDEGIALDLADTIRENMPNYSKVFFSDDTYVKQGTTDAGYIPAVYELNDITANEGINKSGPVVRRDWLEAVGMDAPQTYDDYHEMLTAMKDYCEYPMWMPYTGAYNGGVFSAGYGITTQTGSAYAFINVDGTIKFCPLEDGYKQFLELMNQWYNEGLIDPDFVSYNMNASAPTDDQISSEQVAVWSAAANLMDYSRLGNDNVVVQAITNPVQKAGDTTMFGDKTPALGGKVVITTCCEQVELAERWCDWWYTEDGFYTANYGIEGVSYELDADGNAKYTDVILNPSDGMTVNIAQSIYTCGNGLLLCVQDPTRAYQWYKEDQIEAEKIWATVDKATCLMPAITMTADESDIFSARYADIQTYLDEMLPGFIIGANSFDEWDSFIENIKKMGIDECIEVEQAALDRYYDR